MSEMQQQPIQVAGLRDTVRGFTKETLNIFSDLRQVVKNFNIRTKPARDDLILRLKNYYNRNIPEAVKTRIYRAIKFLENVKDDIVEGVKDGIVEDRHEQIRQDLFKILFQSEKQKSEMDEFIGLYGDEIDRVIEVTDAWSKENRVERHLDNK